MRQKPVQNIRRRLTRLDIGRECASARIYSQTEPGTGTAYTPSVSYDFASGTFEFWCSCPDYKYRKNRKDAPCKCCRRLQRAWLRRLRAGRKHVQVAA